MGTTKNFTSVTAELMASRTEDKLHDAALAFRNAFVQEYLIDFRGDMALARIGVQGYSVKMLRMRAYNLLREPYVAGEISRRLKEVRPSDVVRRGQVMSKLWEEANDYGNEGNTRVAATAHIAKMLGMDKDNDRSGVLPNGVMMIPVVSLEDWQTMAATAQATLKAQAQDA